ncbi:MAG TPA: glycosyltransferase [Candidatus Binatia bacterium]|nr:glycosyltransferase [Candidatus Binatia bacterium]
MPEAAPRVSVVVPCYDLGRYLDEAIDSVLSQTYQDVEILVIDDGSRDPATVALLDDYRRPRTRVLRTPNRGLAAARNLGVAEARGVYLCALDADDRLAPTFLERAVALLDADPALAFVSSWLETFGDETWLWRQDACDLVTLLGEDTVHTAAVVRRAIVQEVGGYATDMGVAGYEDWDLWLSIVERGHRGTIIPEVLFHYRRRAGSMSSICGEPANHGRLVGYLIDKHGASYQAHLLPLLERKDRELAGYLRQNWRSERVIEEELEPMVAAARTELTRLRDKLAARDAADAERRALETALADARREAAALRASWSWRLSAPARAALRALQRLTRRDER